MINKFITPLLDPFITLKCKLPENRFMKTRKILLIKYGVALCKLCKASAQIILSRLRRNPFISFN